METFLDRVVERTRADLAARKAAVPLERLEERLGPPRRGRPFSEALVGEGIALIAEMKRASPSQGPIRPDASVRQIVRAYEAAGASACSVLTEPHWFGGSLDDLVEARAACDLPLLRKDFIIDPYQLVEARIAGADAVLLIVAALTRDEITSLYDRADELGMDCLVEVHDEDEMAIAVECGMEIIGVNNRNLQTLEVDTGTALRLLVDAPAGTIVVAESGIASNDDVQRLEESGVDAILVGEVLMRHDDPAAAVHALLRTRTSE
ncbi:MAG: indole-3-glycerol phosphate synthase TrpC [Thermoleophilia bacterium]|nr:indole-3-glycerol phosphate synthase TrpC [Thermoleophilia bacterium]